MKIFLSFLQSEIQHPIPAYSFWEYYIKNGIEEAGYEWIECPDVDWAKGLVPQSTEDLNIWRDDSWEKTVAYLKKNPADLFLSYLYPHQIDENAIQELRKMGVFCVNFFCDNVRNFIKAPSQFKAFDLNWVPEFKAQKMYKKAGYSFINVPMPMWVEPKYRDQPSIETDDISFIGSKDILRQLFFEELVKKHPEFTFNIYGNGWKDNSNTSTIKQSSSLRRKVYNQIDFLTKNGIGAYLNKIKYGRYNPAISNELENKIKGRVNFEDYINISRQSKITIGSNRYPSFNFSLYKPDTYSRLRDIEAPMLGACYLTEHTEGLNDLYDIGTEIMTYQHPDDFLEKCELLSRDHSLRKMIRENGQKKALTEHSIPSTLKKLMP